MPSQVVWLPSTERTRCIPSVINSFPAGASSHRTSRPCFSPVIHPAAAPRAKAWRAVWSSIPIPMSTCSNAEVHTGPSLG